MKMKITRKRFLEILEEELQNQIHEKKNHEREKNNRALASAAEQPAKIKGKLMDEGDDHPALYRSRALDAVDTLRELIADVDSSALQENDIATAVEELKDKLEYYMS